MTPGDRNPSRLGADFRRALLEAAFALLDAEGPARVSVRATARRLDASPSAVARHFPDRGTLLTEMATAALRELTQGIEEARAVTPPGAERWRAVGAAAYDYATRFPHRYALCWRFDEMQVENARWREAGEELCARLRDSLSIRSSDDGDSLVAAGSLINGYVVLRHCGALGAEAPSRA